MLPQKWFFFTSYVKIALLFLVEKSFYIFIKLHGNGNSLDFDIEIFIPAF